MNKSEALKELSGNIRDVMKYARSKGVTAKEVKAMKNRLRDLYYAFEDVE